MEKISALVDLFIILLGAYAMYRLIFTDKRLPVAYEIAGALFILLLLILLLPIFLIIAILIFLVIGVTDYV